MNSSSDFSFENAISKAPEMIKMLESSFKMLFSKMEKKFVSLNIACSSIEKTLKLKRLISD